MKVVCLDLEGVLVPEIWINVAEKTQIDELRLTTRDIPDYGELMNHRIQILRERNIKLADIQSVIRTMEPLPGGLAFLDALRAKTQVIILSDTFTQFAAPLMEKLKRPTLFCNTLTLSGDDEITGFRLRQEDGKTKAVKALQSMGLTVFAGGDSFNDTGMLLQADRASFFKAPDAIRRQFPQLPGCQEYQEFMTMIDAFLKCPKP